MKTYLGKVIQRAAKLRNEAEERERQLINHQKEQRAAELVMEADALQAESKQKVATRLTLRRVLYIVCSILFAIAAISFAR